MRRADQRRGRSSRPEACLNRLFQKLKLRLLLLLIGTAVATVLIGVVYRCWGKDEATLAVYWLTAIIVLAYTYETHGMRREMVRQNEIAIQPLLVTSVAPAEVKEDYRYEALIVHNIGRGPALFVRIDPIAIAEGHNIDFEVVDYVEAGKSAPTTATYGGRMDFIASLNPKTASRIHRVTLRYEDINKRERYSVMQMGKDGIRLLDHGEGKPTGPRKSDAKI
jgi:hypothetical protein